MTIAVLAISALLTAPLAAQPRSGHCCMGAGQQTGGTAPVASNPVVDVNGVISEVHISPGQGMPYIDVKQGSGSIRLYLGAMYYLIAENFNPKAGQQIAAKGYKLSDSVIGIQVSLPAEKRTLKLRDEKGWPLWAGGRGRPAAPSAAPK